MSIYNMTDEEKILCPRISLEERIIRLERLIREGQEDLLSMLFSGRPSQVSAALSYGIDPNEKVNGKTNVPVISL